MNSKKFLEKNTEELRRIQSIIQDDINKIEEDVPIILSTLTSHVCEMINIMDNIITNYKNDIEREDKCFDIEKHIHDTIYEKTTSHGHEYDIVYNKLLETTVIGYSTSSLCNDRIVICVFDSTKKYNIAIYIITYSFLLKGWVILEDITKILTLPCIVLNNASNNEIISIVNTFHKVPNWSKFKVIDNKKEEEK